MKKKSVTMLLSVVLCLAMMAPVAMADVVIGGLAPLSGEVAQYGIAVQEGVNLYIDKLNDAGGINGEKVKMIWYDEKGDVIEAINAFNKLVDEDKVVAIIGDVTSKPTLAVSDLAGEIGIPMISASSTSYDVTTGKPSVFRSCFLDPFQASTMANFAKDEFGATKVAVIYDIGDDYSVGLAEAFKAQAETNGQEVVAYEAGAAGDVDFKAQLTNIAAKGPEVLFVAYYYGPAALIVKQAAEVGLNVKFLGADGINGIENVIDDKTLLEETVFYSDHFASDATTDAVMAFNAEFESKYGKKPYSAFNATAYDAALVLCEAMIKAGSTDFEAVVEAMKATDVEGVTGRITFDDHNDPIKNAYVMTFKDGKQTFVACMEP